MNNYVLGRSREYAIMRILRKMGAVDVTRSYGSHGKIDVRAIFPTCVLLIQAKADYIPKKELVGVIESAKSITSADIFVMLWCYHKKTKKWTIRDLSTKGREPMNLEQFKKAYAVGQASL